VLPKGYPNKTIVYFEYEVEEGYEYAVGKTTASANPTAGFFYLILGGAGYEGGGMENMSSAQRIDYVMRDSINNLFPVINEEYTVTRTHLSFSGTSS
jgi:hypothetical protein